MVRQARTVLETPTSAGIADAIEDIVERFHPVKVILFGSCAYGETTADSDVDLLVIMDTPLRPVDQAAAIRKAVDFPFPVDLLVRTPRQVSQRLAMGDGFIGDIVTKGKVLHEAAHA